MSNVAARRAMATELANLFVREGKILTAQEYTNLGDSAPYRLSSVSRVLGRWIRVVEKVKNQEPELTKDLPTSLLLEEDDILGKMQAALDKGTENQKDADKQE